MYEAYYISPEEMWTRVIKLSNTFRQCDPKPEIPFRFSSSDKDVPFRLAHDSKYSF